MTERYTMAQHMEYRRREDEKAEREVQERRAATREAAKKAWVADGGTPQSFESAWKGLQDEQRKERLREASTAARQAQRGISTI
jgi:hypothetical protein